MSWPKASTKRTYYQTRGKVHLAHHSAQEPPPTVAKAWCGVKLEDSNNVTTNEVDCTCQKCLMVMTRNWKPRAKKEKKRAGR